MDWRIGITAGRLTLGNDADLSNLEITPVVNVKSLYNLAVVQLKERLHPYEKYM